MPADKTDRASFLQLWAVALTGLVALSAIGWLMVGWPASGRAEEPQSPHREAGQLATADSASEQAPKRVASPIPEEKLIHAKELAEALAGPVAQRPAVLHIGFHVLYRGGHIAGSRYIGPASRPAGLQALREALGKLPRTKQVVLYCGCCPWTDCPNVRPGYAAVESTGRSVKILLCREKPTEGLDRCRPADGKRRSVMNCPPGALDS
jgi:hypothetical protein